MGLCSCRSVKVPMLTPDPYPLLKCLHSWREPENSLRVSKSETAHRVTWTQDHTLEPGSVRQLQCAAQLIVFENTWTTVSVDAQQKYRPLFLNCRRCWIVYGAQNLSWVAHSTPFPREQDVWRKTAGSFPAEHAQNLASEIKRLILSILISYSNRLLIQD